MRSGLLFGLAVATLLALALIPGVSRSGATIVGALLLGVGRRAAAEFSFFLAMPTMAVTCWVRALRGFRCTASYRMGVYTLPVLRRS